jgi:hypothetical protein
VARLLRVHAALFKALDAELEATHGIPLSSYEVLISCGQRRMAGCAWPTSPTASC